MNPNPAQRASGPICHAPDASLYLDPQGNVRACCQNHWQHLGSLRTQRLREIWDGEPLVRLREAVASGSYDLGCELCAACVDRGSGELAFSHVYDHLGPIDDTSWPVRLEFAISNVCNLQCVMCNGEFSSAIRSQREHRAPIPDAYGERFFEDLDAFLPHLEEAVFLGGEPFLAPASLRVMRRLVELGLSPQCHVTTNGTQWSEKVASLVRALPMHIAVSVDGATAATFERIRVGASFERVRANLEAMRSEVAAAGGSMSLAFSMMRGNWHELGEVLAWADRLDVDVFVNTVVHPAKFSLHHAPHTELAAVVARMGDQDLGFGRLLERNLGVWKSQLETMGRLLDDRARLEEVRVEVSARGTTSPIEHARKLALEASETGEVSFIVSGPDGTIAEIGPDSSDVLGLDLSPTIGGSLVDAFRAIASGLGRLVGSSIHHHDDGVEVRTVTLDGGQGVCHHVTNAMAVLDDGSEWWYLAVEHRPGS